jgi:hypothetical protein
LRGTLPRILAVVLAFVFGAAAFGQTELPDGVTTKSSLSPSEEQAIADWATSNWAMVSGDSPVDAREARRRLVAPLLDAETSAGFRLAMDRALAEELQRAIQGDDVFRGVNACLLSGWLGTDRSVRALTENVRSDQVAVRFASVSGLGYAFRVAGIGPVAFQGQVGNAAVDALAGVLASTENQSLLDASVKSMIEAMSVPDQSISGFGARSAERLTTAVGERINTLPIDEHLDARLRPLLRAMGDVRTQVTQRRGNISQGWQTALMELLGRTGALGFRYVRAERAGTLGGGDGEQVRTTVETALRVSGTMPTLLPLDRGVQDRLRQLDLASNFDRASRDGGNGYQQASNNLWSVLDSEFNLPRGRFNLDN